MDAHRQAFGWTLCALLVGCASTPPPPTASSRASDPDFVATEREPFTPPPARGGQTGQSSALRVGSGEAQARAIALSFVRALIEGDRGTIHALLAERIVHAVDGRQVPRAAEVERCMGGADLLTYEPDLTVEDLVDVRGVQVERAEHYHAEMPIPVGIERSDLVVSLPPLRTGRSRRRVPCLARVYVRTGTEARIVALTR